MSDESSVQSEKERHPHRHARRTFLAVTASLSLVVTLASGVAMGAYFWTEGQITTIKDWQASPGPSGEQATPTPPAFTGKCASTSCNYLLLGSDSRAGLTPEQQQQFGTNQDIGGSNRSDTIILVHTQPGQKKATFLSFPRDLWVNIPGVGFNKINAAFSGGINHGGAQMVARTVTALTGIRIDHVLYVDLAGFEGLVNALGGVQMCVPYPMQDPLTALDIPAGCQHFDGKTALAYVRTRHQICDRIPDFARIARQQQFLRAVIAKLLSPRELLHLSSLVPALLRNLVVDKGLNVAELAYLAGQLNGVNTGNVDFRVVPTTVGSAYLNGMYLSIVNAVQPQANELFRRIRDNQPLGSLGLTQQLTPPSPAVIKTVVYARGASVSPSPVGLANPSGSPSPLYGSNFTSSPSPATSSVSPVPLPSATSALSAANVFDRLTQAGFDTSTPIQLLSALGELPKGLKGSVILFDAKAADGQAMADVVASYLSNVKEMPAPKGLLPAGVDIAVVVTPGYELPPPPTSGPTSISECP